MNTTSELDTNKVDIMRERFIESMRGTPPPQKTAEQMLIDRIKSLEMDMRESSELNEHLQERIKRLDGRCQALDDQVCNLLEICRQHGVDVSSQDMINGRRKAKEAKP